MIRRTSCVVLLGLGLAHVGFAQEEAKARVRQLLREAVDTQRPDAAREALSKMGEAAIPGLIEALEEADGALRSEGNQALTARMVAALVLAEMGPVARPALPYLRTNIRRDRQALTRFVAAMAVAKLGEPAEAAPVLIGLAGDKVADVPRALVLRAFEELLSPDTLRAFVPQLIEALGNPDEEIHDRITELLHTFGPEALTMLAGEIANAKPGVRLEAASVIIRRGDRAQGIAVLGRLLRDEDFLARAALRLWWLGEHQQVLSVVNAGLAQGSSKVRAQAAKVLARVGTDLRARTRGTLLGHVTVMLTAADPSTRQVALGSLWVFGRAARVTLPQVSRELRDPDPCVRLAAAGVLARLGDAAPAVPIIVEATKQTGVRPRCVGSEEGGTNSSPSWPNFHRPGGLSATPALIEALNDSDARVRSNAANTLGELGPEAAGQGVPVLMALLANSQESEDVRGRAAYALGMSGDPAAIRLLGAILGDRGQPSSTRWSVLWPLQFAGPKGRSVVSTIVEVLGEDNAQRRETAADVLRDIGPEAKDAVPALKRALNDPVVGVRVRAAGALMDLGEVEPAVAVLLETVRRGGDPPNQIALYELASAEPTPTVVAALADALKDPSLKLSACLALRRLGPAARAALPALVAALSERENRGVCVAAVTAFGPGAGAAVPALLAALAEVDQSFALRIVDALAAIGPAAYEAQPRLASMLQERDEELRVHAAAALVKMGDRQSAILSLLIQALEDEVLRNRLIAADALASLGRTDLAVPVLAAAVDYTNFSADAARMLGKLGKAARPAVPALMEVVRYWNPNSPEAAAEALGNLGPVARDALPVLRRALKSPLLSGNHRDRQAVREAIEKISGRGAQPPPRAGTASNR